jgi:hypothetical protein
LPPLHVACPFACAAAGDFTETGAAGLASAKLDALSVELLDALGAAPAAPSSPGEAVSVPPPFKAPRSAPRSPRAAAGGGGSPTGAEVHVQAGGGSIVSSPGGKEYLVL